MNDYCSVHKQTMCRFFKVFVENEKGKTHKHKISETDSVTNKERRHLEGMRYTQTKFEVFQNI